MCQVTTLYCRSAENKGMEGVAKMEGRKKKKKKKRRVSERDGGDVGEEGMGGKGKRRRPASKTSVRTRWGAHPVEPCSGLRREALQHGALRNVRPEAPIRTQPYSFAQSQRSHSTKYRAA